VLHLTYGIDSICDRLTDLLFCVACWHKRELAYSSSNVWQGLSPYSVDTPEQNRDYKSFTLVGEDIL
jgi:hypothetical protein